MAGDASAPSKRWEEATRATARLLEDRTCIVIVGERDDDAANVALAIAEANVRTRRVAIVDAVGDLPPLQNLLPRDARPHGVIDHFLHGVSLRKIAHAVNRDGTLFILPSGVGPFEYATLLRRERWRRLIMAFRSEAALLCIVLPHDAEGLAGFVEDTNGIVTVGNVQYPEPRHVIANIPGVARVSADAGVVRPTVGAAPAFLARVARQARSKPVIVVATAIVAILAVGALLARGRGTETVDAARADGSGIAVLPSGAERAGMIASSAGDSVNAAVYSVDIVMLNSIADAGRHLTNRLSAIPAATFSPVQLGADSVRWYRLLVGAWRVQREADSALLALRDAGVLERGFGSVRRTPFALRVVEGVSPAAAIARAVELRSLGLPAYVLGRDEDHAGVYAGAFETPSQAMPLLDMFKRAGIDATVAYRIGRGI